MPPETAAVEVHILCTPYNHAPVDSVTLFEAIYIAWCMCLTVTCTHTFGRIIGIYSVLLQQHEGRTDPEIKVSTKSWPQKRIFPPLQAGIKPMIFWSQVWCSTTKLSHSTCLQIQAVKNKQMEWSTLPVPINYYMIVKCCASTGRSVRGYCNQYVPHAWTVCLGDNRNNVTVGLFLSARLKTNVIYYVDSFFLLSSI